MTSNWKRLAFAAIIVVGTPVLLLLLLEGGLRVAGAGYPTGLFLEEVRDGATWLRDNPDYTAPFFGREIARRPFPFLIRKKPADGSTRILVLGGSAALGDPEPAFSVSRMLEASLQSAWPGRSFECINLAITAINSHVVRDIARAARALQPDIVILYLGNNEVIGPFGPGTRKSPAARLPLSPRMETALRRSRVAQALDRLRPGRADTAWLGMEQFSGHRIAQDSAELRPVYDAFRDNLNQIIGSFDARSTGLIVSTVAVNLKTQAPFAGVAALAEFHLGHGQADAARAFEHLVRARDLDELRFRADSTLNQLIREAAAAHPVMLVEAEARFNNPGRLAGPDEFLEHVHFTFHGNHVLTALLLDAVSAHLQESAGFPAPGEFPDEAALRERLAFTDYDAYLLAREMVDRLQKLPFSATFDNDRRLQHFRDVAERLRGRLARRETREAILATCAKALAAAPDDWVLQRNCAGALRVYGRFPEAARLLEKVTARFPDNAKILAPLGGVYLDMNQLDKARAALTRSVRLEPRDLSARSDLAVALLNLRESTEARRVSERALALGGDPLIFNSLIFESHLVENERPQTDRMERLVLALDPDAAQPAVRLARLYAKHGETARALALLEAAAEKEPDNPMIRQALTDLEARPAEGSR